MSEKNQVQTLNTFKECDSQDDTEPNGCTKLEYICECKEWGK